MLSTQHFQSQAQTNEPPQHELKFIRGFPDGSKAILIDGVEYRALTAEQMRDIQKVASERDEAKALLEQEKAATANLAKQIELLKRDIERADAVANINSQEAARYKELLDKSIELNDQATKLLKPGRINKFLDKPVVRLLKDFVLEPSLSAGFNQWFNRRC